MCSTFSGHISINAEMVQPIRAGSRVLGGCPTSNVSLGGRGDGDGGAGGMVVGVLGNITMI